MRVIFWTCIAILAVLLLVAVFRPRPVAPGTLGVSNFKGKPAPAFSLKTVDGKTVTLSSYKGKVVLVNYWATWCPPCQGEIPWLVSLQKQYGPQGLQVIGISMDDSGSDEKVLGFAHEKGITYPVAIGDDDLARKYGSVDYFPTSFLIDRQGNVVDRINGAVKDRLDGEVKELVEKGQ